MPLKAEAENPSLSIATSSSCSAPKGRGEARSWFFCRRHTRNDQITPESLARYSTGRCTLLSFTIAKKQSAAYTLVIVKFQVLQRSDRGLGSCGMNWTRANTSFFSTRSGSWRHLPTPSPTTSGTSNSSRSSAGLGREMVANHATRAGSKSQPNASSAFGIHRTATSPGLT